MCIGDDTKGSACCIAAQTTLGKQKIRSMGRRYLSYFRNLMINYFSTQNFTEIGQLAAFETANVRHVKF